jgi:hypothetical protein
MCLLKSVRSRIYLWPIIIVGFVQSIYLIIQFRLFEWTGIDDLLTLTLISQDCYAKLFQALSSGLNLFPPLYFLAAYFLVKTLNFAPEILLWVHIPLLWISLFCSYKIFAYFTSSWLSSFATVVVATVKSAFLTQSVYVRPYCLYYCSCLLLLILSIKFKNEPSRKSFFCLWFCFQVLTLSHYYGLVASLLICLPLVFIKLPLNKKIALFVILLTPTVLIYSYFLPKQMSFIFFKGTTGESNLIEILNIYKSLSLPGLLIVASFFVLFVTYSKLVLGKNTSGIQSNAKFQPEIMLLALMPLFIGLIQILSFGEGMYFRYFIPCQIAIIGLALWFCTRVHQSKMHRKYKLGLFILCIVFTLSWATRNFDFEPVAKKSQTYTPDMEFEHSKILLSSAPFYTSHFPTFLKNLHNPTWSQKTFFLRTDREEFEELQNFHVSLSPSSLSDLENLNEFFYHFYFSGPHSLIDFNPETWSKAHGFETETISQYPLVVRFRKLQTKQKI